VVARSSICSISSIWSASTTFEVSRPLEVPTGATTAIGGQWVTGQGSGASRRFVPRWAASPPVIAEDLGVITDEVRALLKATGFPA